MKSLFTSITLLLLSLALSSCSQLEKKKSPCNEAEQCYEKGINMFSTLDKSKNSQDAAKIFQEAALLFKTGCELKSANSCFELARFHKAQHNIGVSLAFFNQACELGHKKACKMALKEKNK